MKTYYDLIEVAKELQERQNQILDLHRKYPGNENINYLYFTIMEDIHNTLYNWNKLLKETGVIDYE